MVYSAFASCVFFFMFRVGFSYTLVTINNKELANTVLKAMSGDIKNIIIIPTTKEPKLNTIFKSMSKKAKCKFNINYQVSGEAFLTKPNKTTYMVQNTIKKITKIKPKLSTTGGTSDARFIRKIAPCLEFGLVGKTMHKIDESVSLSDLKKLTNIYLSILENYFK